MLPLHHYYLLAIEMIFTDSEGTSMTTRVNTLIQVDANRLTMKDLGRAQQGAQIAMMEKSKDPNIQFHQLTILNTNYLGEMTAEEFTAGMDLDKAANDG